MTTFPICSIERQFELKYTDETGNEPGLHDQDREKIDQKVVEDVCNEKRVVHSQGKWRQSWQD